ncbi:MAG: hypothetical protein M5U35_03000 [Roseovarius sp.]|nr:hypothetical protein [Roseovarius sp.]
MSDGAWIQTISGKRFPLEEPDADQINIEDIAYALSMQCRFNGHCTKFYSVAEHSVHVSREIDPKLSMVGLLHDAAEAYLGDVPSPLKKKRSQFSEIEEKLEAAIGNRFGIDPALFKDREMKRTDTQLLVNEKSVLMVEEPEPWPPGAPAVKEPGRIEAWGPDEAKARFLAQYRQLM